MREAENELLTRTGPGTPCGELLRRYWQPAALSEELPPAGAPLPVRLLSEDLVLFRDNQGRPGLLALHCSHRGADLSYGRIEDGGIRCIYHGWLYDIRGRCQEQPGEPPGSTFAERIQHPAYPCTEQAGIIFAYLGPGEPPLLPNYEFLNAPEAYRVTSKVFQDCNYLQVNEGNLDPVHLSFLHRMSIEGDLNQLYNTQVMCPLIETEETDFGVRIYAVRKVDPRTNYVRVTNFVLPNLSTVTGTAEGYSVNWPVPIDDTHNWRYGIRFQRHTPMSRDATRYGGPSSNNGYRLVEDKANRYLQDRDSMKTWSFNGLGKNFVVHDTCATEGAGPIQDRTREHPGYSDRGIIAARFRLLGAIRDVQEGRDPPHVIRHPTANPVPNIGVRNDVLLPSSVDWHNFWETESLQRDIVSTSGRSRRVLS